MLLNTAIFNQTVEMAKAKSANNPAMLRAIERAVYEINHSRYWAFADGVLRIQSTTSRKLYVVDDAHTCEARGICKHKVARRLMIRYTEALGVAVAAATVSETKPAADVLVAGNHVRRVQMDSRGVAAIHGVYCAIEPVETKPAGSAPALSRLAAAEAAVFVPRTIKGETYCGVDI